MGRKPVQKFCVVCGKSIGFRTRRRYCNTCLGLRLMAINKQLKEKRGPVWEKWKKNYAKAMERLVIKAKAGYIGKDKAWISGIERALIKLRVKESG